MKTICLILSHIGNRIKIIWDYFKQISTDIVEKKKTKNKKTLFVILHHSLKYLFCILILKIPNI